MTPSIDRTAAVNALIAFVCIAGIGMTAATLNTAEPVGASGDDQVLQPPNPRDAVNVGNNSTAAPGGDGEATVGNSYESLTRCVAFLSSTAGTMLVFAALLGISLLVYHRYNAALSLFVGWTIFPPTMLAYFILTDCGPGSGIAVGNSQTADFSMSGEGVVAITDVPSWLLVALVATAFVGAVALLYRSAGGDETAVPEEHAEETDVELDRFAEAAGRAADRIEKHNDDVDNAVYRAWLEMTELLDVESPSTYSAGEFAATAVDVGMDEADVTELTRLFNEVRYGGRDVETREKQAVSVLRTIESQYGEPVDADGTADDPTDDGGSAAAGDERAGSNEGAGR